MPYQVLHTYNRTPLPVFTDKDSNLLKELTWGMASAAGFKRFDPIGEARPSSQLRHSAIMLGIVLGAVSVSLRTRGMETSMIVCSATAL